MRSGRPVRSDLEERSAGRHVLHNGAEVLERIPRNMKLCREKRERRTGNTPFANEWLRKQEEKEV